MLDDKDEFIVSIWAEHCLREAQSLIQVLEKDLSKQRLSSLVRYRGVVTNISHIKGQYLHERSAWYKIVRNFMVNFDAPINEGIRAYVSR